MSSTVTVSDVVIVDQSFSNGASAKTFNDYNTQQHSLKVSLLDSLDAELATQTIVSPSSPITYRWEGTFSEGGIGGLELSEGQDYTLRIEVLDAKSGNNIGFDSVTLHGTLNGGGSDYDIWAGDYPGLGQPGDDDDNDGLTNDEERLWGLDPTSPASVNPIAVPFDAGTFTYQRRDPALSGATFSYEYSTTLAPGSWQAFTPNPVTTDGESPVETVTVTLDAGLLANRALFVRVVAVTP